ncbi:carbohydrate-binding protein [Flavivirga aquimarina]|uniref:Carbohydrate-binding protein n=1 Tax=Flavivirga aquimarina TaxID=2027862 RepID=A0ABT8WF36_9FLAO|nr:carbohydrate-binding protein [Flavivirga aquimarina]MDO5971773.1 carbohydrate-binding protein [Flavivirga aquimarina]
MFKFKNIKKNYYFITIVIMLLPLYSTNAQTVVNSLAELITAVKQSNQEIVLAAGNYNFDDLASDNKDIDVSGSNNNINLTGAHISVPVGSVRTTYIHVSGNNNTIIGGEIEDVYRNNMTEVTDFSAYNQDRDNLAYGLRGAAVLEVSGEDNLINGIKLTVRGSFPYGYGSMYGINQVNTFGLDKRCGLLINGKKNTLDNVEVQQRAFGHAIFMQGEADETVIKNTYVEGRTRPTGDLYYENQPYDLPFLSGFKLPYEDNAPFTVGEVHSLCEDGIRQYNGVGSVTVENCTVKKTRGGIRLYLGGNATVKNSTAIDCGNTNWNLPANAVVENSAGNFTNGPLRDNRLGRSGMTAEWTIIPSPNSGGMHNIADVLGNNQNLVFHRTDGPLDDKEKKAIVVAGDNSTIVNETEYTIILEASANGNTITSCGPVIDNGSGNNVTINSCDFVITCNNTVDNLEAECYDSMSGVQTESIDINNDAVSYTNNGDWISFNSIDLSGMGTVKATTSSQKDGVSIEIRRGSVTGTLLGTIAVPNTSNYGIYQEVSADLTETFDGVTDIYFVFTGPGGFLLNVDEISFEKNLCTETIDPVLPIQLEDYCEASGVQLAYLLNDNQEVGYIHNGDYLKLANVDFDEVNYNSIEVAASSKTGGGTVELRTGTVDGPLLGSIAITNTGAWDQYEVFSNYAEQDVSGVQDLFVVFVGGPGSLFNVDYLYFRNDPCLEIVDAFSEIDAIEHCEKSGVVTYDDEYVGSIHDGDWVRYGSVDFGSNSPVGVTLSLSGQNNTDGYVNVMLDDPTNGTMIATATVPATGGWTNWENVTVPVNNDVTGIQDVYVYFGGGAYNLNWLQFRSVLSTSSIGKKLSGVVFYPNPVKDVLNIKLTTLEEVDVSILNLVGQKVYSGVVKKGNNNIQLGTLNTGMYIMKMIDGAQVYVQKIIIDK